MFCGVHIFFYIQQFEPSRSTSFVRKRSVVLTLVFPRAQPGLRYRGARTVCPKVRVVCLGAGKGIGTFFLLAVQHEKKHSILGRSKKNFFLHLTSFFPTRALPTEGRGNWYRPLPLRLCNTFTEMKLGDGREPPPMCFI